MLQASAGFNSAIKEQEIKARCKVVFNYHTPITFYRENIISITEEHNGGVVLGGLQDDKIILTLLKDSLNASQCATDTTVDLFVGCSVSGVNEYVKIGRYKTVKYTIDDYEIEVELGTNIDTVETVKKLMSAHNVLLSTYMANVINVLVGITPITASVKDTTLLDAYCYAKTVGEQLKLLGVASNCLIRLTDTLEVTPYYFTPTCYTLAYGANNALLEDNTVGADSVTEKKIVEVQKSRFIFEESTSIFSANFTLQSEETCYLDVSFSSPSIPRYCLFGKQVGHEALNVGMFGGNIYLYNQYIGSTLKTNLNVVGDKVLSKSLGLQNDITKQYITNPYIQNDAQITALDIKCLTARKKTYKIKGDPRLQLGDTIATPNGIMLITKISSVFDGAYLSTLEGVEIDADN